MGSGVGTQAGAVAIAAIGVLVLTPPAAAALRRHGVLDVPDARSSHTSPTPRGAGLVTGAVLTVAIGLGWDRLAISLAAVALLATVLGGLEDLHGVRVAVRFAAQAGIATVFFLATWDTGPQLAWPVAGAAGLFVVGYINAFNFMDGINGISAVSAAVAGLFYMAVAHQRSLPDLQLVGLALAVTAASFLPFNFPSARVFLGDSGRYSFGAVIACAAVAGWRAGVRAETLVAPLAIYLADTGTSVLRRAARREPIATPHREHVYQQLVQLGASHAQSTGVVLLCSAVTATLGVAAAGAAPRARIALDIAIIGVVAVYLALPRILRSRREGPADRESF